MAGRDTVELALGGVAGVLVVVIGYGAFTGVDDLMLGAVLLALVAVLFFVAARRLQDAGEGARED